MNTELKEQLLKIIFKNIEDELEDYLKENDDNYVIDFRYNQIFSKEDLPRSVRAEFDKIIIRNKRDKKLKQILK